MNVSVIIPAHNAAKTIARTLESLLAQTSSAWEAIVIDDGSTDGTAGIVALFSEQDSRIRVISQPQGGVSIARNQGMSVAHYDWLLFLDADDWIAPTYIEKLTHLLSADPTLDVVYCGWARTTAEGQLVHESVCPLADELFATFAQTNPFAIHACLVRRSLIELVGGFDPSLRTCEDWDLWQRIARAGANFGRLPELLAYYCMQPTSASIQARQILQDALRVITRGHAPDPRVPNPLPAYANGLPLDQLSSAKQSFACWSAGLAIGSGDDARPLLQILQNDRSPGLNPHQIAEYLFSAIPLPTCQPLTNWGILWSKVAEPIHQFLVALEAHSASSGLARRVQLLLESLILKQVKTRPLMLSLTYAVQVEITEPLLDIHPPEFADRLWCDIQVEGESIGEVELPIFKGTVSSYVLTDAIAAEFAWGILGRFFWRTIYKDLYIKPSQAGIAVYRGDVCLVDGLPYEGFLWKQIHDRLGWTIFLQEVWGRPHWPQSAFYDLRTEDLETTNLKTIDLEQETTLIFVEVSDDLNNLKVAADTLNVMLTVGGAAIKSFAIPLEQGRVSAQQLRSALTAASGYELCCAAVREGLIGKPFGQTALRNRLATMAANRRPSDRLTSKPNDPHQSLDPAWISTHLLSITDNAILFGHRTQTAIGTSASRRAMLPAEAIGELLETAQIADESFIQLPAATSQKQQVFYVPELMLPSSQQVHQDANSQSQRESASTTRTQAGTLYDRSYFEKTFAQGPTRWDYNNAYEQTKYEQTLSLLPPGRINRALELACAEGHFTVQLARRVNQLIASDFSQIALDRAAERCAGLENVSFIHLDLIEDPIPDRFDLIVCSEVLYFMKQREILEAVGQKFADALEPGGYLLIAHANILIDDPESPGFDWYFPFGAKVIGETIASVPTLNLVKELRTPLYRIHLFQRQPKSIFSFKPAQPEVIEMDQPTPPPAEVAADVRWNGGVPRQKNPDLSVSTYRLPILMYHRVAPTGSAHTSRWRVTPEAFEEQLCYLRDAGFYSVTLEDWRIAMATKQPLPGRAVLITFDDGYLDFLTYAYPLLKRYGFSAVVFLVAHNVGKSNSWDRAYGEELPLLDWEQIRQLQAEGIEFGSHTCSHRPLTGLSHIEIVQEAAQSRAILQQELGVPVRSFAYPHGDSNPVVEHLIGACGYVFGLSCQSGFSHFENSLLALPRIEIQGDENFQDFVMKLSS